MGKGNLQAKLGEDGYIKENSNLGHFDGEKAILKFIREEWKGKGIDSDPSEVCCDHLVLLDNNKVILLESKPQKCSHASTQLISTEKNISKVGYSVIKKLIVIIKPTNRKKGLYKNYGYNHKIRRDVEVYIYEI